MYITVSVLVVHHNILLLQKQFELTLVTVFTSTPALSSNPTISVLPPLAALSNTLSPPCGNKTHQHYYYTNYYI